MSCCAPGAESGADEGRTLPSSEELWLASKPLGDGRRQTDLSVPDVHCGACIATIEDALNKLPEVERARVNLSTRRVSIVWHDTLEGMKTDPVRLAEAIAATGYSLNLFQDVDTGSDRLRNDYLRAVAIAGFAAANIMLLSVSVWSGADAATRDLFHWISAMIAAPVLIYAGRFFYRSAWNALKHGHTNMDVPISLAVTLSYAMSLWETIHHGEHAWFDATVSLLFFLLIGRTLDHLMRDRARAAVVGLARLSPRGATVIASDGSGDYRPVEDIRPGDRLAIAAGERIPVDSRVLSGTSDIDWSIVNGESAPQPAATGARLLAGTLNLTGGLTVEATAEAKNSFLAEIITLMEAAEGGKARYRRIADRAARLYSPAVHLLALISLLGWGILGGDWKQAVLVAISVLIITCPCALGLAVPVVQVIAAGRLYRSGIMVKDGSAMERLAEATMVLFDKTGTLTMGRPQLVNAGEIDPHTLAIAAGLAEHSRHPLSRAIAAAAQVRAQFQEVREIPGAGLVAKDDEGVWRLGSRVSAGVIACDAPPSALPGISPSRGEIECRAVSPKSSAESPARNSSLRQEAGPMPLSPLVGEMPGRAEGGNTSANPAVPDHSDHSESVLSLNGTPIATFRFEDRLRPHAIETIRTLSREKLSPGILSGDREPVVAAIGRRLGIASWTSGLDPQGKVSAVEQAAANGARVLMVGDGINDAPALRSAHVSIAPSTAADIGKQAADFVFMRDGLDAVWEAIDISRRAGHLIRENFALAIAYNIVAVPVAIAGYATPLVAAIAMSTSSIIVVVNSLRLNLDRGEKVLGTAADISPNVEVLSV